MSDSPVGFTLNRSQWKALQETLNALALPAKKRKRLLWRILKLGVMPRAKRHAKRQENAEGRKWPARWSGDARTRKMMRHLPGFMVVHEMAAAESAKIYLRGPGRMAPGVIGALQSEGTTVRMSAASAAKGQKGKMATLRQAKKLLLLGYEVTYVSHPRQPSANEIMRTLSMKKAGAIIRAMEKRDSKDAWTLTLPSREWLAVSDEEFNNILARQMQAIQFGANVRAQDLKGKIT